jgi:RNA polymerase sigma-70 factor, ECF subfamily
LNGKEFRFRVVVKIATNEVNQFYRKKKYQPSNLQSILNLEILDYAESFRDDKEALELELEAHHDFIEIQKHMRTLDPNYQALLSLRFFENKEIREISFILEKPEGTTKSLISRGLEKLRKKIYQ